MLEPDFIQKKKVQAITPNICALQKLKTTIYKPYHILQSLQKKKKEKLSRSELHSKTFKNELCKLSTQHTKHDKNLTVFLKQITKEVIPNKEK